MRYAQNQAGAMPAYIVTDHLILTNAVRHLEDVNHWRLLSGIVRCDLMRWSHHRLGSRYTILIFQLLNIDIALKVVHIWNL
jgi:hypothetical protein